MFHRFQKHAVIIKDEKEVQILCYEEAISM